MKPDTTSLDAVSSRKYELLDYPLCQEIDHINYELAQVSRQLDIYNAMFFHPLSRSLNTTGSNLFSAFAPQVRENILEGIDRAERQIADVRPKLKAALEKTVMPD